MSTPVVIVSESGEPLGVTVTPCEHTRAGPAYAAGREACLAGRSIRYIPPNTDMVGWFLGYQEARPERAPDLVIESDSDGIERGLQAIREHMRGTV